MLLKSNTRSDESQTIEKANVEKMKRRHPNITNEIFMEKRVLNKLNHPNIVEVFSTFQDYGTLYYHMEYLPGGELWPLLKDNNDGLPCHVGCYWSLARFYLAEAINVIEYMHRKGVVHRDIKPENIMITANGHIKFVDFGTAKDLVNTNLNGQDFVGTPGTVKYIEMFPLFVILFVCVVLKLHFFVYDIICRIFAT